VAVQAVRDIVDSSVVPVALVVFAAHHSIVWVVAPVALVVVDTDMVAAADYLVDFEGYSSYQVSASPVGLVEAVGEPVV